jgi:hypothetical protein
MFSSKQCRLQIGHIAYNLQNINLTSNVHYYNISDFKYHYSKCGSLASEASDIFCVYRNKNCGDIKPNTMAGRIVYKYNSVTSKIAVQKGLDYNHFHVTFI